MDKNELPRKVLYERMYGIRRRGWPKTRWKAEVMNGLRKHQIRWTEEAKTEDRGTLLRRAKHTPRCSTNW